MKGNFHTIAHLKICIMSSYHVLLFSDSPERYSENLITALNICAESVLSHPFIVLRRQCQVFTFRIIFYIIDKVTDTREASVNVTYDMLCLQVNGTSQRYHLFPITLIPAFVHVQTYQGVSAFWKGLGSILTIRGLVMALEDSLSKFTPWPK